MKKKDGRKKSVARRRELALQRKELARIKKLVEERVEKRVEREVATYREYMQLRLDSRDAFINMLCSNLPLAFIEQSAKRADAVAKKRPK